MFCFLKIHVRKSDTNTLRLHHYLKNIIIGNILTGGTGLCHRHITKELQDSFQASRSLSKLNLSRGVWLMCNLWNVRHDKWEDLQETLKTRRKLQITTIFSAYYNDLIFSIII